MLQVMMKISESIASVVIGNDSALLASIFTSLIINNLIITNSNINNQTLVVILRTIICHYTSTRQILMITIIQVLMVKI